MRCTPPALCAFALLLAACSAPVATDAATQTPGADSAEPATASAPSSAVDPSVWPQSGSPFGEDPALEARVADLLSRMTLEEKVGQVIQADIGSVTPEEVREYDLGSILNGGNSAPNGDNYSPPEDWLSLADAYWLASTDTSDGGLGIPVIWGTDAVHGHNNVVGATIFPHNIGLGAARNPDLIRRIGEVTALELRVTGPDWTFAPTLAVVRDDRWGRTYEGYSENPELVARYATAMIEGLQGEYGDPDWLQPPHVPATAKHFIGDGGTQRGVDQGDNRDTEADLARIQGAGYPPAIEAGVMSIMASFNSWHGEKIHGHEGLLTDILVGRLGFDGFVVGDWNGHGQVAGCTATDCAQSFNAGVDLFMAPDSWRGVRESLLRDVRSGAVTMERLDEAVSRVLRAKVRAGLLDAVRPSQRPYAGEFERLGSAEHRAVAREAVRQSLVLLKNDDAVLPINGASRVLVAGAAADDIGQASGGWTLNWQGEGNENSDFPNGQSILGGLREALAEQGGEAVYSPDGAYETRPDVAIVVFGEEPYAEFQGDRPHLDFQSERGLEILRRLQAEDIPVVAVFLSGRPMWMNPELNASDAFVAAWLPGTEGGGVADVLIGDADGAPRHDFAGRLTFSWPKRPDQSPLNVGDADYDPLFAYGFGASYAEPAPALGLLPEDMAVRDSTGGLTVINAGRPGEGYALTIVDADGASVAGDGPATQTASGALTAEPTDRAAQEDTRRFIWSGPASIRLTPGDDTPELPQEDALVLTFIYEVEAAPEGPVTLAMACGAACAAGLDVTQGFDIAAGKGWREATVDLSCFAAEGAEPEFTGAVEITADAGLSLTLADMRIASADIAAGCEL